MCLTPIMIDNPNYNTPIRDPTYHLLHDTVHSKIPVPCGRCASCIHLRQIYMVQRVQMEALSHDLFYGTLTYNNDSLPIAKYGDIRFAYPDITDWQKAVKMIRKNHPEYSFKYLLVSEYGSSKHRPHYHFILSLPRTSDKLADKMSVAYRLFGIFKKYWRRNYGSTRNPDWRPLFTYVNRNGKYNYDLHWLDPNSSNDGLDGVSFYVTKYVLKYDEFVDKFKSLLFFNLKESDYKYAWSLFKPRVLMSKGFGSPDDVKVQRHIIKGINFAIDDENAFFPYYISSHSGQTFPLCPYYSKRFLSEDSQILFRSRLPDYFISIDDIIDFDNRQEKLAKTRAFLRSQNPETVSDSSDINMFNFNDFIYGNTFEFDSENQEFVNDWRDSEPACDTVITDCNVVFQQQLWYDDECDD